MEWCKTLQRVGKQSHTLNKISKLITETCWIFLPDFKITLRILTSEETCKKFRALKDSGNLNNITVKDVNYLIFF